MQGILPVALQLLVLAWILSLLQWLHGVYWAWYGMLGFGLCAVACVGCWLVVLLQTAPSDHRLQKQKIALQLSMLLAFAFSMTFIMIFMYHWLNEDGHVHGASGGAGTMSQTGLSIGPSGHATVFSEIHMRGYRLPVTVNVDHGRLALTANQAQSIVLMLKNHSELPVALRLSAKVAPSAVKTEVNYALLHHDINVTLAPKSSKAITHKITIGPDFPADLQPFTLAHFVFGQDDVSAWKKMQGPIKLQKP